jgi:hypothetical protein
MLCLNIPYRNFNDLRTMTHHLPWREFFLNWPATIPRRGVVLSTLNEPTPFKSFLTKGDLLLLERTNPDAMGARFILISYDAIHMVKFTDPFKETVFTGAGFVGKLAQL